MDDRSAQTQLRILLVDDHVSFMDGLEMVINTQPAMTIVGKAKNRDEAFNLARTLEPDLIILDLDLGDCQSLEFLPELIHETSVKTLILTGIRDADLHEQAIMLGARGILFKGEPSGVILRAIEKVSGGEIWISNATMGRILDHLNHANAEPDSAERKIADLTAREREIIIALMTLESSTNDEIARQLFISSSTLKNHLTTIYSKLDVKNRVQLMKFALAHKITK